MTVTKALQAAAQLHQRGQLREAEAIYRQILAADPRQSDALHLLGVIAHQVGEHEPAAALIREAIALDATVTDYHNNLGLVLDRLGRVAEAEAAFRTALRLQPDSPEAHNNLANTLRSIGRLDEAIDAYATALRLRPNYPDACCNLATALADAGEIDAAVAHYRTALRLRPDFPKAHSHLIFTLHYHPDSDPAMLARELHAWRDRFAAPLRAALRPHDNDRTPGRPLRVGYVSPDLRQHAVGRFLLPLLAHHDRTQAQVYCYSDVSVPDDLTARLRSHSTGWRETFALSDAALAEQIRADRIDVLVDLVLHCGRNRLGVFARKPAPVQVTYLAYCGSSGLDTMDYRFTDRWLDPTDTDRSGYSEESVHLPSTYWCYQPVEDCPPVSPLPAARAGHVTFGCLNNFCKINDRVLAVWSRIMRAVPDSALLLHAKEGRHRQRTRDTLARAGVARERVRFTGHVPLRDYCAQYHQIDLALDPFPYGGGTTTCDALWMGVPVITWTGRTAMSRAGASILMTAGLADLVTHTEDEYVARAVVLARDWPALAERRARLRDQLRASPLMDAPRFAAGIEAAYRSAWHRWCATPISPNQ